MEAKILRARLAVFLGMISMGNERRKPLAIFVIGNDANLLSHAIRIAYWPDLVNPMNASVH